MTNPKGTKRVIKSLAVLCMAWALGTGLQAQSSTPPPASASVTTAGPSVRSTSGDTITTLEKFTVSDVPITEQILPTVRPISSVYGDDESIIDIPRSVSSVNKAWMDDRQVKNAMDFGQFSPGVYAAADYGIPGVPQIRGDYAQVYVNGELIPWSRNSVPLSFNNVEAMDIVKGPGSAVYGPQGNGPGGYVNFVSKQPYFDHDHADISTTFGYWTSGHSYSNPEYTIDFGGPLSDKLAYRVSYLARYGNEYYLNAKDQTQDVYAALTYRANNNLKFEWWGQLYSDLTNEINGGNRVTEAFIKNGSYIAGPAIPSISSYGFPFGVDIFATPNDPYPTIADGTYSIVDPTQAHTVKLPAYKTLVGPEDSARAKLFHTQLKTTYDVSADTEIINLTYYGLESSRKFETYGYDEWYPHTESFQDRFELHTSLDFGRVTNSIITGAEYRYTNIIAYDDFQSEPFPYYDLSQPLTLNNIFYPGYYAEGKTFGSGAQIPSAPGYGSVEQQDSKMNDLGLFVQDHIGLTKRVSAIIGFREDYISAQTKNPPLTQAGYYDEFFDYVPLATPLYFPAGGLYRYSATKWDPSYFTSLIFKITDSQSVYATYDRVDAIHGAINVGGVDSGTTFPFSGPGQFGAGSNAYVDKSLSVGSALYEVGYKGSFLHNTLFFGASLFQQLKTESQVKGSPYRIKDNGLELDVVYQPTKALSLNANLTYQDATAFGYNPDVGPGEQSGGAFFQETGTYLDDYATTTKVDGTTGTGVGATNFTGWNPPSGRMRAPGVPQLVANLFVEYKLANGLGFGMGPNFIGKQYANDNDTLYIPSEYQMDGYILYAPGKRWDVRLNISNITNQRVLDPIDVSFAGNDVIYVRKPISSSITIRLHL
jgi:iron complex outermembrane receptor protein